MFCVYLIKDYYIWNANKKSYSLSKQLLVYTIQYRGRVYCIWYKCRHIFNAFFSPHFMNSHKKFSYSNNNNNNNTITQLDNCFSSQSQCISHVVYLKINTIFSWRSYKTVFFLVLFSYRFKSRSDWERLLIQSEWRNTVWYMPYDFYQMVSIVKSNQFLVSILLLGFLFLFTIIRLTITLKTKPVTDFERTLLSCDKCVQNLFYLVYFVSKVLR